MAFAFAMAIFGLITMPAGNFLSRQMERAADRYAIRTTGKVAAFRSVMVKLAGQNLSEAEPPTWVRFLFYSHPPISERIRLIPPSSQLTTPISLRTGQPCAIGCSNLTISRA